MNKDQLQKELKEKIKEGIKPSDLKKKDKTTTSPLTPPDSPVTPIDKKTEPSETKEITDLKRDVKYWSTTAQTHLKNLQLITATLTNTQEENKELKKKIKELEKQKETKKINMVKEQPQEIKKKVKTEPKKILIKSQEGVERSRGTLDFFCEMCEENKTQQHLNLRKLNSGLGMDLTKLYKVCDDCVSSGRWDWKTERNNEHDLLNW